MSVMVRVEKFKNLQNKACLPSLRCYLLCPGYFGGDSLNTVPQSENVRNHHQSTQDTNNNEEKVGKLYFANS